MRKAPKQARSRDTVDAILTAATQLLCRRGWAGLTTNEVAEVAGVSVGSLYQYFPNKSALVTAIRRRHDEAVLAAFTDACGRDERMALHERAKRVVRGIVAAHEVAPELGAVLEQVPRDPSVPARDEFYQAKMQRLKALVSRGDDADAARTEVAAHVLWGAIEGVLSVGTRFERIADPALEIELNELVAAYLTRRVRAGSRRPIAVVVDASED